MKIPHVYLSILKSFFQCLPGILFICAAVLADQLGIDNNPDWGKGRTILLLAGLFLLGTGLIIHFYQAKKFPEKIHQNISGFISRWRSLSDFLTHNVFIALILCAALVLLMTAYAAWFTSNGKFINFPRVDNPYIDLGDAFLHGQAALLEQPDPRLLALKNPYDYEQRKNIPTYWDASLYKGKYFIYWGPVPALFYTAVQAITRTQPPGQLGIILAYLGSGSVLTALLFQLRRMFYPKTPALSLVLFLPATLINIPYLYLLGRSQVYETSIIFGQFFLFFGLLGWLIYLQSRKISWLALASLCWGLSIGSRYNLVIAVGIFLIYAAVQIWLDRSHHTIPWKPLAALIFPLGLCGLSLAAYNFIRFDNAFETGMSYQLTIELASGTQYSFSYILSNLYLYLLSPLLPSWSFPFFPTKHFQPGVVPGWASLPVGKGFEDVFTGLLPSVPLVWLLIPLVLALVVFYSITRNNPPVYESTPLFHKRWLLIGTLITAGLLQFGFLLIFFFTAMRYVADFYLLLVLAIFLGWWELDGTLRKGPIWRKIFWLAASLLTVSTVLLGYLAGFDIPPQYFRLGNPQLFYQLSDQWDQIANLVLSIINLLMRIGKTIFHLGI